MILSIQSHVAFGRVGNRAAVFPLELLGHEVIVVNTVQFSNHTGYGAWRGEVFPAAHIRDVIAGIDAVGRLGVDAVLSGYMGDLGTCSVIVDAVDRVRALNPDAVYCLDPVMGDYAKGFFVREGIPEYMKNEVLPRSTIITPNQFEAEYLSGVKIRTVSDAALATAAIRARGPSVVLVTSFLPGSDENSISMYLSTGTGDYLITTDRVKLDPEPNGGGDLTAALFLGHYLVARDPVIALEKTANSVYAVYERTGVNGTRELALVDARFDLLSPPARFRAALYQNGKN
jgi:pyridoxine kinase